MASFADLGGVWAVDAGYTFYVLEQYGPLRAVLVDEQPTSTVLARANEWPSLTLLQSNFGDRATLTALGRTDAVLLFDVLLHQVSPDWDEILRMYSNITDCFIVVNPQYIAEPHTTRLLELGRDRYLATVPAQPGYEDLFDRLDEFLPDRARHYRDIHNVWQWGIVDTDLRNVMHHLGFDLVYFENAGQWRDRPAFENHAFVFMRSEGGVGAR